MTAAHRWRRNELIDFAAAEASNGFVTAVRLSAGGVSVSRGRIAANEGVEVGSAQLVVAVIESDALEMEWRPAGDDKLRRDFLLPEFGADRSGGHALPCALDCPSDHSRCRVRYNACRQIAERNKPR